MSYSVFTIIYGFPLSTRNGRSTLQHKFVERELEGLIKVSSKNAADPPAGFGVLMGKFTECCHHVEVAQLPLVPNSQQKNQLRDFLNKLSPRDQALVSALGEPRVFFLVGTT